MKAFTRFRVCTLTLFFLVGLGGSSCSKVGPRQNVPENNPFAEIGRLHNEGVEYVYEELKKCSDTRTLMAEDMQTEWSDGMKDYFEDLRRLFEKSGVNQLFVGIGRLNDRIGADEQLSRSEKDALFCCTATAVSSLNARSRY